MSDDPRAWTPTQVEHDILRIEGLLRYRRGNLTLSTVRDLEALRDQLEAVQREGRDAVDR